MALIPYQNLVVWRKLELFKFQIKQFPRSRYVAAPPHTYDLQNRTRNSFETSERYLTDELTNVFHCPSHWYGPQHFSFGDDPITIIHGPCAGRALPDRRVVEFYQADSAAEKTAASEYHAYVSQYGSAAAEETTLSTWDNLTTGLASYGKLCSLQSLHLLLEQDVTPCRDACSRSILKYFETLLCKLNVMSHAWKHVLLVLLADAVQVTEAHKAKIDAHVEALDASMDRMSSCPVIDFYIRQVFAQQSGCLRHAQLLSSVVAAWLQSSDHTLKQHTLFKLFIDDCSVLAPLVKQQTDEAFEVRGLNLKSAFEDLYYDCVSWEEATRTR